MQLGYLSAGAQLANLVGVLLLFRYGVPFKADLGVPGYAPLLYKHGGAGDAEERILARYKRIGWFAVALISLATATQAWISVLTL